MIDRPEAILVLLSDLHFGAGLLAEAELPPLDFPLFVRLFDSEISEYTERRCGAHDIGVVKSLPRYLRRLLADLQDEGFYHDAFDLFLLLGDLATWPAASSYRFLQEYLTQEDLSAGDPDLYTTCAGLNISPESIVAIPGNHDKLLRTSLDLYLKAFLKPLGLPTQPQPQTCTVVSKMVRGLQFVFFQLEASRYSLQDLRLDRACRNHLAGGEITPQLKASILDKISRLEAGGEVDGVSLSPGAVALKILLVHYAVNDLCVSGSKQALDDLILPHACVGLESLVRELRSHIHLVAHGHLHVPKLYNFGGVPVIAATTTTQKGGQNGFFLLKVSGTGEMEAQHHIWNGAGFALDPRGSLNRPLESVAETQSPMTEDETDAGLIPSPNRE